MEENMAKTYGGWSKFQPFVKEGTVLASFRIVSDDTMEALKASVKARICHPFHITAFVCRLTENGLKKEGIYTKTVNEGSYFEDIEKITHTLSGYDVLLGWDCTLEKKILKMIGVEVPVLDLKKNAGYFHKFFPEDYQINDVIRTVYRNQHLEINTFEEVQWAESYMAIFHWMLKKYGNKFRENMPQLKTKYAVYKKFMRFFEEGVKLLILDTETTGLTDDAKIIQFSAIRYCVKNGKLVSDGWSSVYINPEEPLTKKITEITGLTDEKLAGGLTEKQAAGNIFKLLASCDVWGAYNSSFDHRMLSHMAARTGYRMPDRPVLDLIELPRNMIEDSALGDYRPYQLENVFSYLYPSKEVKFHDALADVKAAAMVTVRLLYDFSDVKRENIVLNFCDKEYVPHVEYVYYDVNEHAKGQIRLKVGLSEGRYGDVYWDVIHKRWDCKNTHDAVSLFAKLDLTELESMILWKYHCHTMQETAMLLKEWKEKKENKKEESA